MNKVELLREFIWENVKYLTKKSTNWDYVNPGAIAKGKWWDSIDYSTVEGHHPLYGACHRAAAFYLFLANGEAGTEGPVRMKSKEVPGIVGWHTWCEDEDTGVIWDLTPDQLPDYVDDEWYRTGNIAKKHPITLHSFGNGSVWAKYGQPTIYTPQVPGNYTLELAKKWKEKTGSAEGLEYWLKEKELYLDWLKPRKLKYKNNKL